MKRIFDEFKKFDVAVIGGSLGFVLGLFLILFGFWKTLFVFFLTGAGYYIGKKFFNNKDDLKDLLDRILPPGKFR
ncbi:MAG: DUF2273 domain-containing protein [Saccharofermentanales bacterium]